MITTKLQLRKGFMVGGTVSLAIGILFIQLAFANITGISTPFRDGAYLQWTPSTGTTHYTLVDESACNGTTDYNATTIIGNRDSYGISISSIPSGATITKIDIKPCASRNNKGSGSATINVFYRFNGVNSSDAGNYALIGTTPTELATTSFTSLSLVRGPSSTLEIGAVLSAGNKGARLSRIVTQITYDPLLAPSNLNAVNISSSQNDVSWIDNSSNEDGFRVERSTNSASGPWPQIATTSANAVSYSDTGLTADQTYFYRVRGFNAEANTAYTNTDFVITATVVPNDPSNLNAAASSTTAILNWTDNATNEEGTKIERSTDNINFTEINSTGSNAVTYTDFSLAPGTYYYQIRAFNVMGNSGYSNILSVIVP